VKTWLENKLWLWTKTIGSTLGNDVSISGNEVMIVALLAGLR